MTRRSVNDELFTRFPNTVVLALMAAVVFLIIGVTLGIFAAVRRGSATDRGVVGASQVLGAIPYYVLALLVALYPVILWNVLPQYSAMSAGVGPYFMGMLAPALILGFVTSASYVRYTRNSMIETLSMDYIRTARSKGISERTVLFKHGFRAAMSPIATILGLDIAALLDRHAHHRADLRCRRDRPSRPGRAPGRGPARHHGDGSHRRRGRRHHEPRRRHRILLHRPASEAFVTVTASTISTQTAEARNPGDVVLEVSDLSVAFPTEEGVVKAVSNLSYQARLGRTLAIVGESGSGKSVSSMAVLGLHNPKRTQITGSIKLDGLELVGAPASTFQKIRSTKAAMVFQDPQSSLHPFHKIGNQIAEAYRAHHQVSKQVAHKRAVEMLDLVGIPNPQRRASQYPHEFSGGMRQRAMIALGLVNNPKLLIADEPTTALDVTVQAQILDLVNDLQKEFGSAVILITHDLAVVAETADDILVMYAGRGVEKGDAKERARPAVDALHLRPAPVAALALARTSPSSRPSRARRPACSTCRRAARSTPAASSRRRSRATACFTELPEWRPTPGLANREIRCHLADPVATLQNDEGVR